MIIKRITGWPRWEWRSPFEELELMRRQMDQLVEGLRGGLAREGTAGVLPLMNVTEDADHYYVRAELPGIKTDELDISVTGTSLSLAGERTIPAEDATARYHRREREAGTFNRVISLPTQIDPAKVEARSSDGILTVVLPKAEEAKPKKIAIKTS